MIIICFLTMEEKYKTNGIFPNCYLIAISINKYVGYYHFPPPPGPLRGFLASSCIEDYFVIEFSVCGGEIGPLSLSTDLSHRNLFGSSL